jgi:hypothetical protein
MRFRPRTLLGLTVLLPITLFVPAGPAAAEPTFGPRYSVASPATTVASRTDRRPMAGGIYDARVNKTFISWSGANADSYVQEYDHRRGTYSAPIYIDAGIGDTHNYPTMIQADNGKLLIFRGMHNVELVVSEAPTPHSAAGTWTHRIIPEGIAASYPMPFKAANGDIYVFYRRTDNTIGQAPPDQRPMLYVRSRDNGKTWSNSTQLTGAPFAVGSIGRADNMDEIYFGQMRYEAPSRGRTERVHIVYTLAGGGTEGQLHDRYHRNIYYAYFLPSNQHFYNAAGKDLGVQIDDADQEGSARVVETPLELPAAFKTPDYIQQVGWSRLTGRPFVLYFTGDTTGLFHNFLGYWDGRRWQTKEVTTGVRFREIEPVFGGWRVYSTDPNPGIKTALLTEWGSWIPGATIPTAKPVQRIELITNFRDPARLLVTGASSAREASVADGDIHVIGTR